MWSAVTRTKAEEGVVESHNNIQLQEQLESTRTRLEEGGVRVPKMGETKRAKRRGRVSLPHVRPESRRQRHRTAERYILTMSTQDSDGIAFSILSEDNQQHFRLLELPAELLGLLTSNDPPT